MSKSSLNKIQLYYVYDPMCSWCWGYRPTWLALKDALQTQLPEVEVSYLLGGLAADSDAPMPEDMQQFLAKTWHTIANQLGTQFNFDFWQDCQPRRSTYPACRACLIAREFGLEEQMKFAIQQAYYLQAKNPSDDSTLIALAGQLGINETEFSDKLLTSETQQKLMAEIELAHSLPIRGFPSLVMSINGKFHSIAIDYQHWENSFKEIKKAISY
ncbi:DsbA family protein [Psychromonas marina]|uniref:DsbA family protein n=1 Tax=Psychromonas marina TaxID=88364 RepID=A0ABQ6DWS9_9GAMM|nr:DsbA family protein [Psychromonas marina]GLS89191.1 DsbA family protein [Psychromonas marina]